MSASAGGRVVEVNARKGDRVTQGDVLVRLETERLDNEIAKQGRTIRAGEEELARLDHLEELLAAPVRGDPGEGRGGAGPGAGGGPPGQGAAGCGDPPGPGGAEGRRGRRGPAPQIGRPGGPPPRRNCSRPRRRPARRQEKLAKARLPVDEEGVAGLAAGAGAGGAGLRREAGGAGAEAGGQAGRGRGRPDRAGQPGAGAEAGGHPGPDRRGRDGGGREGRGPPGAGQAGGGDRAAGGFRFEAAVPSEEVGRLRVGMPARIKLDAYDYQRYGTLDGTVCFISPDSGVAEGQSTPYTVRIDLKGDEVGRGPMARAGPSSAWRARRRSSPAGRACCPC